MIGHCDNSGRRYDNYGTWCARVERGATRDERVALLAAVPDKFREAVRRHVECCFRVKVRKDRRVGVVAVPWRQGYNP
jgi:hypothetical protein